MTLDLAGVGIGPFNLSLAALADGVPGLTVAIFERRKEFRWHPGCSSTVRPSRCPFSPTG